MLIGAQSADVGGRENQGAAYVFVRSGGAWIQQARLTVPDGVAGDRFGTAVALQGDSALIGAPGVDVGGNEGQGAAYVFVRSGSIWTQQTRLTVQGGAAGDALGGELAVDGDTALIAACGVNGYDGSAYVFVHSATTWQQQAQLMPLDLERCSGFGLALDLDGDTAIVGTYYADPVNDVARWGGAWVFVREGASWTQQAALSMADRTIYDYFGHAVSVDGDKVWWGHGVARPRSSSPARGRAGRRKLS